MVFLISITFQIFEIKREMEDEIRKIYDVLENHSKQMISTLKIVDKLSNMIKKFKD